MPSHAPVLVVGARGRVGREVVRALLARGASVRALVRDAATVALTAGVETCVGDLHDRPSLDRALAGVAGAFFVTPHDPDEERLGIGFVEAAEAAKIDRLVFASAFHDDFTSALAFSVFVGLASLLTHYGPKLRVEARVRRSSARPVVLMPSNFFQNDETFLPEIAAGRYPQPLGLRGVNRVDCRDIGEAAARALTDPSIASGGYPLVGPDLTLTGPECAATWARHLGREVKYEGDIAAWWALAEGRMHTHEREDFRKTYRIFGRQRVAARPADVARVTGLLGRAPTAYDTYVADLARTRLAR